MAKKSSSEESGFSGIISTIKDTIIASMKTRITETFEKAMDALEARLLVMQKRLLRSLGTALFACTALVLVLLSGMFYLHDTLGASRAVTAFALALAFAAVALCFYFANRT